MSRASRFPLCALIATITLLAAYPASSWAQQAKGNPPAKKPAPKLASTGCDTEVITPVIKAQRAVLSDPVIITRAVDELTATGEEKKLEVSEVHGRRVVCDPEKQGADCQARKVTLASGTKLILRATEDLPQGVKAGELIMIDPGNLMIVDRSRSVRCVTIGDEHTAFNLSDKTVMLRFGDHNARVPLDAEFWPLIRALPLQRGEAPSSDNEGWVVPKESMTFYDFQSSRKRTLSPTMASRVGGYATCATKSFLKIEAPKILIPEVAMKEGEGS